MSVVLSIIRIFPVPAIITLVSTQYPRQWPDISLSKTYDSEISHKGSAIRVVWAISMVPVFSTSMIRCTISVPEVYLKTLSRLAMCTPTKISVPIVFQYRWSSMSRPKQVSLRWIRSIAKMHPI